MKWASLPGSFHYERGRRRACHFAFYIARTEILPQWMKVFEHREGQVSWQREKLTLYLRNAVRGGTTSRRRRLHTTCARAMRFSMRTTTCLKTWSSKHNRLHTDFEIHSTEHDANRGLNPWQFANFDDQYIGFPRDCGPTSAVGMKWASLPGSFHYERGNRRACHFASILPEPRFYHVEHCGLKFSGTAKARSRTILAKRKVTLYLRNAVRGGTTSRRRRLHTTCARAMRFSMRTRTCLKLGARSTTDYTRTSKYTARSTTLIVV